MKVIYDKETDTLSIILREGKVTDSDEVSEGLIFDYDKTGGSCRSNCSTPQNR